eukprot:gene24724-biopygen8960
MSWVGPHAMRPRKLHARRRRNTPLPETCRAGSRFGGWPPGQTHGVWGRNPTLRPVLAGGGLGGRMQCRPRGPTLGGTRHGTVPPARGCDCRAGPLTWPRAAKHPPLGGLGGQESPVGRRGPLWGVWGARSPGGVWGRPVERARRGPRNCGYTAPNL